MFENDEVVNQVFFGIMVGDLFPFSGDVEGEIDESESVANYAAAIEKAVKAEYGENVEVDYESQNVGGAVPHGLLTRVNNDTDHELVEEINYLINQVWVDGEWLVVN